MYDIRIVILPRVWALEDFRWFQSMAWPGWPIHRRSALTSICFYVDVSENSGTPKSSIWIGFSIINHPFWGTPIFGNTHVVLYRSCFLKVNNGSQQTIFSFWLKILIFEPSSQKLKAIRCLLGLLVDMDWSMMKRIEDQATDWGWQDLVHMWLLISSHAFCWIHGTQINFDGLRRGLHAIDSELEQEAWARWKRTHMISGFQKGLDSWSKAHHHHVCMFLEALSTTSRLNLWQKLRTGINRDDIGWQSWCFFLLIFRLGTQRLRRIRDFLCGNQARDSFTRRFMDFSAEKSLSIPMFQNKETSSKMKFVGSQWFFPLIDQPH